LIEKRIAPSTQAPRHRVGGKARNFVTKTAKDARQNGRGLQNRAGNGISESHPGAEGEKTPHQRKKKKVPEL